MRVSHPTNCHACDVRFACHGGCPKERFTHTTTASRDGTSSAPRYQDHFRQVNAAMRVMVEALRSSRDTNEVMTWCQRRNQRRVRATSLVAGDPSSRGDEPLAEETAKVRL